MLLPLLFSSTFPLYPISISPQLYSHLLPKLRHISYAMGFKDIFVRCSRGHYSSSSCCYRSSYQRLHCQTDDMTVMQGKLRQQPSGGDAISCIEKPSTWWHFYSALVLTRVLDDDAGFGPFIVFSSPWGLPVLSHPALVRRKKIGSSYRKSAL